MQESHGQTFLRAIYGCRMFSGRGARDLEVWLEVQAELARTNEDLVRRFVEECRGAPRPSCRG